MCLKVTPIAGACNTCKMMSDRLPPYSPSPPPPSYVRRSPMLIPLPNPYMDDGSSTYSVEFADVYEGVTWGNCPPSILVTLGACADACCALPPPVSRWLTASYERILGRS